MGSLGTRRMTRRATIDSALGLERAEFSLSIDVGYESFRTFHSSGAVVRSGVACTVAALGGCELRRAYWPPMDRRILVGSLGNFKVRNAIKLDILLCGHFHFEDSVCTENGNTSSMPGNSMNLVSLYS